MSDIEAEFAAFMEYRRNGGGNTARFTIGELWALWRDWALAGGYPSWQSSVSGTEWRILPFWGNRQWTEFTLVTWDEFVSQLAPTSRGTRVKPGTVHTYLMLLKTMFNFHVKRGRIPRNPADSVPLMEPVTDRDFYVTDAEFERLVAHADPPVFRLMLVIFFETACRRDEIRRLKRSEYKRDTGTIDLSTRRTKTKRPRVIPLTDIAIEALELSLSASAHIRTDYIFPGPRNHTQPVSTSTMWYWMQKTIRRSGVKGPEGQRVWVHTLRHSFASLHSASGHLTPRAVMAVTGHRSHRVLERYVHLAPTHREEARAGLNARRTPEHTARVLSALRDNNDDT